MAVPFQKQHVTIEEFKRLGETEERLELLYGEIVEMSPIGPRHIACLVHLIQTMSSLMPRALLSPQNPLEIPSVESLPQPDLVLLKPRGDLAQNAPTAEDALLVIEIADSSFIRDRDTKIPLYAKGNVPESWLVDLNSETLWAYRQPSPTGYRDVRPYRRGDSIAPEAFPDTSFAVDEILG
jgi:Uma2 family endonuclease